MADLRKSSKQAMLWLTIYFYKLYTITLYTLYLILFALCHFLQVLLPLTVNSQSLTAGMRYVWAKTEKIIEIVVLFTSEWFNWIGVNWPPSLYVLFLLYDWNYIFFVWISATVEGPGWWQQNWVCVFFCSEIISCFEWLSFFSCAAFLTDPHTDT